jgi:hypothetical protein
MLCQLVCLIVIIMSQLQCFISQNVAIFGYSRKTLEDEDLRSMIEANLTCRVDHQYVSLVAACQTLTPYFTSNY